MLMILKIQCLGYQFFSLIIYISRVIPNKISLGFFLVEMEKIILNFILKNKESRIDSLPLKNDEQS